MYICIMQSTHKLIEEFVGETDTISLYHSYIHSSLFYKEIHLFRYSMFQSFQKNTHVNT